MKILDVSIGLKFDGRKVRSLDSAHNFCITTFLNLGRQTVSIYSKKNWFPIHMKQLISDSWTHTWQKIQNILVMKQKSSLWSMVNIMLKDCGVALEAYPHKESALTEHQERSLRWVCPFNKNTIPSLQPSENLWKHGIVDSRMNEPARPLKHEMQKIPNFPFHSNSFIVLI